MAKPRDLPTFMYRCSRGHEIHATQPVTKCPGYRHGRSCDGTLERFGPGSRTKEKTDVDH